MNVIHPVIASLVLFAMGCSPKAPQLLPDQTNLAGEWRQDSDYFQSSGLVNQLNEIEAHEDFELFFSEGTVALTRIVGQERLYWESLATLSQDDAGKASYLTFNNYDGSSVRATIYYQGDHLIIRIGKRQIGLLRRNVTNLRIKGYVPQ